MSRRQPTLKQHAHGVTLVTHGRLNAYQHIAKGLTQHKQMLAIGPFPSGSGTPLLFDFFEPGLRSDMIIHRDSRVHVCLGAKLLGIAV